MTVRSPPSRSLSFRSLSPLLRDDLIGADVGLGALGSGIAIDVDGEGGVGVGLVDARGCGLEVKVLLARVDEKRVKTNVARPRGPTFDVGVGELAVGVDLFPRSASIGKDVVA